MSPLSLPPFLPVHLSHFADLEALPPGLSSVRILVRHEGMGTLHDLNSQPRRDLALATYLHKHRMRSRAQAEVCECCVVCKLRL